MRTSIVSLMANFSGSVGSIFQALADPTRRAVVERLCQGSASVTELREPFGMALPSFLQHLKVLEGAGLVSSSKQGRVRTVRVEPAALEQIDNWIDTQRAYWEGALDRLQAHNRKTNRRDVHE